MLFSPSSLLCIKNSLGLRVILDRTLSFHSHINTNTRSAHTFLLWHQPTTFFPFPIFCFHSGPALSFLKLIIATPIGLPHKSLWKRQMVQSSAAHNITKPPYLFYHITPVLQQLCWLLVMFRIQFEILLYTFKANYNNSPPHLSNLLHIGTHSHSLLFSCCIYLTVPSVSGIWNSLPPVVMDCLQISENKSFWE